MGVTSECIRLHRLGDPEFDEAVRTACRISIDEIEANGMMLAAEGSVDFKTIAGEAQAIDRHYPELIKFFLATRRPEVYGAKAAEHQKDEPSEEEGPKEYL